MIFSEKKSLTLVNSKFQNNQKYFLNRNRELIKHRVIPSNESSTFVFEYFGTFVYL